MFPVWVHCYMYCPVSLSYSGSVKWLARKTSLVKPLVSRGDYFHKDQVEERVLILYNLVVFYSFFFPLADIYWFKTIAPTNLPTCQLLVKGARCRLSKDPSPLPVLFAIPRVWTGPEALIHDLTRKYLIHVVRPDLTQLLNVLRHSQKPCMWFIEFGRHYLGIWQAAISPKSVSVTSFQLLA